MCRGEFFLKINKCADPNKTVQGGFFLKIKKRACTSIRYTRVGIYLENKVFQIPCPYLFFFHYFQWFLSYILFPRFSTVLYWEFDVLTYLLRFECPTWNSNIEWSLMGVALKETAPRPLISYLIFSGHLEHRRFESADKQSVVVKILWQQICFGGSGTI